MLLSIGCPLQLTSIIWWLHLISVKCTYTFTVPKTEVSNRRQEQRQPSLATASSRSFAARVVCWKMRTEKIPPCRLFPRRRFNSGNLIVLLLSRFLLHFSPTESRKTRLTSKKSQPFYILLLINSLSFYVRIRNCVSSSSSFVTLFSRYSGWVNSLICPGLFFVSFSLGRKRVLRLREEIFPPFDVGRKTIFW